ncbi:hypothetical protein ACOMHN_003286 [Nucella lapillus]
MTMEWSIFSLFLVPLVQTVCSVPIIHAPWGALRGISMQGDGGRKMNAYMGIPYAVPPVGERRFKKPEAHPGLEKGEVFEADKVMPACPQKPMLIGTERKTSEDCLMLDVYVPVEESPTSPKPYAVMVFIHGGGFTMGDTYSYQPSKLVVDGEVIVVAMQYRLAVLGFLSSGDEAVPENMGLWDQNLALRWVKHNIGAFGGDPERITLFGESAGSMSVGFHLVMPQSKGLFKRAIMQSGAPQDVVHFSDALCKKAVFKGLTDLFECQGESSQELVQCLKEQPIELLMNKSTQYEMTSPLYNYYFPQADGELVPGRPRDLVQDPDFVEENGLGEVDIILGFDKNEGAMILMLASLLDMAPEAVHSAEYFRSVLDMCFTFTRTSHKPALKKASPASQTVLIAEFFYRGAEWSSNFSQSLAPLSDMYGDCIMIVAITEWARYLAAAPHSASRHLYVVDHDFAFNQHTVPGAHHGDELALLFDVEKEFPEGNIFKTLNKTSISEEEQNLSEKLVNMWTTFAKTGNPGAAMGIDWPQFIPEEEEYLSISQSPQVVSKMGPYRDRLALWLSHLPQLDTLTSQEAAEEPPTPREEL